MTARRLLDLENWDADENWYRLGCRIAFWDRACKSWTSYLVDENGHQMTEAEYWANRSLLEVCEDAGHFEGDDEELAKWIDYRNGHD